MASLCLDVLLRSPLEMTDDKDFGDYVMTFLEDRNTALCIFMWVGERFAALATNESTQHFARKLLENNHMSAHRGFIVGPMADKLESLIQEPSGCFLVGDVLLRFQPPDTVPLVHAVIPHIKELLQSTHGCTLLTSYIHFGDEESMQKVLLKLCDYMDLIVETEDGLLLLEEIIEHHRSVREFCVNYLTLHHLKVFEIEENVTLLHTIVVHAETPVRLQEFVVELRSMDPGGMATNMIFREVVEMLAEDKDFAEMLVGSRSLEDDAADDD